MAILHPLGRSIHNTSHLWARGRARALQGDGLRLRPFHRAVEFSLDDGEHWTRYETPDTNDYQNLTWTFDYTPEKAGFYVLRVRSVNDAGEHSPESAFAELQVDD